MKPFSKRLLSFLLLATCAFASENAANTKPPASTSTPPPTSTPSSSHHKVLILGSGVAGIIAARTLHQSGIDDFLVIDARPEIGGRMQTQPFGKLDNQTWIIERGPNWVQGTQTGNGPANPIFVLANDVKLVTAFNDFTGSVKTYDTTGEVDFTDDVNTASDALDSLTVVGGTRVDLTLVDVSARTGYTLAGAKPMDAHARAAEYFEWDFEYAQTPEQSSLIASSWNNNFTFVPEEGGFSEDNLMSVDQRGFKTIIQSQAASFLQPNQIMLNSTVKNIQYGDSNVTVTLTNGQIITGDFALCTFSLGVLQNDDVTFSPDLPDFKQEAINTMIMATYTKIFFQFPEKFWFDTEMGLYADPERGRYPVWQSLDHPKFLPGSKIIFVTVTGDYSVRVEALSDDQIKSEALSVLQSMFPNVTIPEPTDFFFPRWHSDPLFRGSYSNWPPAFASQHLDNLRANVGFLHGAYFEGLAMGQSIAACINNTCPPLERFEQVNNALPYEMN